MRAAFFSTTTGAAPVLPGGNQLLAPSSIQVDDLSSTTVSLSWDAVQDAEGYVVERDTVDDFSSATEVYSDADTTFEDTLLDPDTEYFYRVKAVAAGFDDSDFTSTSGTTFTTTYQGILDAQIGTPPATLAGRIVDNLFWKDMADSGLLAECDAVWMMTTAGDASYALINGVNPGTNTATLHGTVSPAYTVKHGFDGNAAQSAYINFNWTPSTQGVQYTLNDASVHVYTLDDTQHSINTVGTTNASAQGRLFVIHKDTSDQIQVYINSNSGVIGGTGGPGLISGVRAASNSQSSYRNGVLQATDADVTNDLSDHPLLGFAYNNNGTPAGFIDAHLGLVIVGSSSITPSTLYTIWNNHLSRISAL
jgi:hypothetical protein